ncbi:MAG: hypothetical protein SGI98_04325 [Verrucomicrobiota bacterium]|nr:hypothetical protein [Verrucomicrobiota bacterium]
MNSFQGEVVLSTLVLWEFRQAARFQVFRHHQDRTQGYSKTQADKLFAALDSNLADKAFMISKVEWSDVHSRAEGVFRRNTPSRVVTGLWTFSIYPHPCIWACPLF